MNFASCFFFYNEHGTEVCGYIVISRGGICDLKSVSVAHTMDFAESSCVTLCYGGMCAALFCVYISHITFCIKKV